MPGVIAVQKETYNTTLVEATNWEGKLNSIIVPMNSGDFLTAFGKWQTGTLIQDAFPSLNSYEREFIMTGTTKEEWEKMFPKEE